jgi:hypothetical protein
MNENQMERLVIAFETLARVSEAWYNKRYPEPKAVKEAEIHYVNDPEKQLLEDQGQTGEETTEEWMSLGRHERDFIEKQKVGHGTASDRSPQANGSDE